MHSASTSWSSILAIEDQKQLDKVWQLKEDWPALKKIVQYSGAPRNPENLGWNDLMTVGRGMGDDLLQERLKRIVVNQCCTLVYSSGTMVNPKGLVLSHNNLYLYLYLNRLECPLYHWHLVLP